MVVKEQTDARRRASAAYHEKLKASGMKKVSVWLSVESREKLEKIAAIYGSNDKAVSQALDNLIEILAGDGI